MVEHELLLILIKMSKDKILGVAMVEGEYDQLSHASMKLSQGSILLYATSICLLKKKTSRTKRTLFSFLRE
jgi:hypothetical protein